MWRFASSLGRACIARASVRSSQLRAAALTASTISLSAAGSAWCDAEEDQLFEAAKIKVYERWRASATRAKEANAEGLKDEAERLFRSAVSDAELFTSRDPRLASSLNNLADFLRIEKRYQEAMPLYARAVACFEKALGREHPLLGLALHNQASFLVEIGDFDAAMPAFERSLKVKTSAFGAKHDECAKTLFHMAGVKKQRNQPQQAELLYTAALEIAEAKEGVAAARSCRWRLQQSLVRMETAGEVAADQLHQTAIEQSRAAVHEAYAKFLSAAGREKESMEMLENALSGVKAEHHKVAILLRTARACDNEMALLDRAVALVQDSAMSQDEKQVQLDRIAIIQGRQEN